MGIKRNVIRLLTAFRMLPVTVLMLAVSVWLMSLRLAAPFTHPEVDPLHYFPGSVQSQKFVEHPEIRGPFQLWAGEWWRIFGSAFHHGDLLHLLLNAAGIWVCARIVERALGWWRYLVFFLTAAVVSMLPELLAGKDAIGLSGVLYAMFGTLLVLRTCNESVRQAVSLQFIYVGFGWLFLAALLTLAGMLPIANGAHAAGLVYGVVIGWVVFRWRQTWPALSVIASQLIHLGVIAATVMVANPLRNGAYYAWMANESEHAGADPELKLEQWKAATRLDRRLPYAWLRRAQLEFALGKPQDAWTSTLQGAMFNRTDEELVRFARRLWKEMPDVATQGEALSELRRIFGSEADAWIVRLKLRVRGSTGPGLLTLMLDEPQVTYTLDVKVDVPREVPGITHPHPPTHSPDEVNPQNPNSALLGESL